jgi:hypothetical protein
MLGSRQQEALKLLAFALMVLDHVAVVWPDLPGALVLRSVGRLAFPLFAYLIAYNLIIRRVDPARYYWPLLLLAVVSQLPAIWALGSFKVNIYGTLLAGVMVWRIITAPAWGHWLRGVILGVMLGLFLAAGAVLLDYGVLGVLLIPALALLLRQPGTGTVWLVGLVLFLLNPLWWWSVVPLLLVPVVMLFAGFRGIPRFPRWVWYAAYPAHLLALGVLAALL